MNKKPTNTDIPDEDITADEDRLSEIGDSLRKSFKDIVEEPIPEEYIKLLDELERKERKKK